MASFIQAAKAQAGEALMNELASKNIVGNYNYFTITMAAFFGVFVRQIYVKKGNIMQRILEYIAGALCSIYGAELSSHILYRLLLYYNVVPKSELMPQSLLSLSAFLCGMFGLSLCELGFAYIFRRKNEL
ncbi:hypothetical protein [Bartonella sp. TP]|uniref:hypothetical protein n=1 Tax=Bartonella sp. TP TaxID=3057550 RepID=UPI0025B0E61C|nr:hypothetical protein [Bartonella sp. TP]WJW80498.1 hypothetical protein QVL57_02730 [Bartonella sp. TP]